MTESSAGHTVFHGKVVRVHWLRLPNGSMPAQKEYEKYIDHPEALAAFETMDRHLAAGQVVPRTTAESIDGYFGLKLWEIKAPARGKRIGRLLCHRGKNWNLYIAFCRRKKDQKLRDSWKKTASERIRNATRHEGS